MKKKHSVSPATGAPPPPIAPRPTRRPQQQAVLPPPAAPAAPPPSSSGGQFVGQANASPVIPVPPSPKKQPSRSSSARRGSEASAAGSGVAGPAVVRATPARSPAKTTVAPLPALPKDIEGCVTFLEDVTRAVGHRMTQIPTSVPQLDDMSASPSSFTSIGGGSGNGAMGGTSLPLSFGSGAGAGTLLAVSLMQSIANAVNKVLNAFALVEVQDGQCGGDVAEHAAIVDKGTQDALSALAAFQRHLETATTGAVQANLKGSNVRSVFESCRRQLAALHASSTVTARVRVIVRSRNVTKALELLKELGFAASGGPGAAVASTLGGGPPPTPPGAASSPPRTRLMSAASSNSGGGGGGRAGEPGDRDGGMRSSPSALATPTTPAGAAAAAQAHPVAMWLARVWVPAMQQWHAIIAKAVASGIRPGSLSAAEDAASAIAAAHTEVVSKSAVLQEILLPGETLHALIQKELDQPLQRQTALAEQKRVVTAALKDAVAKVDFAHLAACIRDTDAVPMTDAGDKELLATAQKLLVDVQHVAKVTVSMSMALKNDDVFPLLRALTSANALLLNMKLFDNEEQCRHAVLAGQRILGAPICSTQEKFVGCNPEELYVEHVPSQAWATELSVMYKKTYEKLVMLVERQAAQDTVVRTVPMLRNFLKRQGVIQSTPNSPRVCDEVCSLDDVRRVLQRCSSCSLNTREVSELAALYKSANDLLIKVHYESSIRVLSLPTTSADETKQAARADLLQPVIPTFARVKELVAAACAAMAGMLAIVRGSVGSAALRIRYQDDEADFVTLLTEDDWGVLLWSKGVAGNLAGPTRIELFCDVPTQPSAAAALERAKPLHSQQQQQQRPNSFITQPSEEKTLEVERRHQRRASSPPPVENQPAPPPAVAPRSAVAAPPPLSPPLLAKSPLPKPATPKSHHRSPSVSLPNPAGIPPAPSTNSLVVAGASLVPRLGIARALLPPHQRPDVLPTLMPTQERTTKKGEEEEMEGQQQKRSAAVESDRDRGDEQDTAGGTAAEMPIPPTGARPLVGHKRRKSDSPQSELTAGNDRSEEENNAASLPLPNTSRVSRSSSHRGNEDSIASRAAAAPLAPLHLPPPPPVVGRWDMPAPGEEIEFHTVTSVQTTATVLERRRESAKLPQQLGALRGVSAGAKQPPQQRASLGGGGPPLNAPTSPHPRAGGSPSAPTPAGFPQGRRATGGGNIGVVGSGEDRKPSAVHQQPMKGRAPLMIGSPGIAPPPLPPGMTGTPRGGNVATLVGRGVTGGRR